MLTKPKTTIKFSENKPDEIKIEFINRPDLEIVLEQMAKESEQSVIIVGHSYLEDLLNKLLFKRLIGLRIKELERMPFHHKVKLCHSIGLLTDIEKRDMVIINEMRNKFAHRSCELTFESDNIASYINKLELLNLGLHSIENHVLTFRDKCVWEIAVLLLILADKEIIFPKIDKCNYPRGLNDPNNSVGIEAGAPPGAPTEKTP